MSRTTILFSFALALAPVVQAAASDPVGIYAVVERVVFEPDEKSPVSIQVWGAFALSRDNTRDDYEEPEAGYMYFSLPDGKDANEEAARKEWADLKKVAEKNECVAFAARHKPKGKVRKAGEKPEKPDPYPISYGLVKVRRSREYSPVRELVALPLPVSPRGDDPVEPGKVTLAARTIIDKERKDARYIFEVKSESGSSETSGEIKAGEKRAEWSPALAVKPGEKYRWRVWVVDRDWKGPAAEASFRGKGGKG